MTDKLKRLTHEQLLAGEGYVTSVINEPFEVNFVVPEESATARARRRWHMESGNQHEQ